jgi:hypothetical protein
MPQTFEQDQWAIQFLSVLKVTEDPSAKQQAAQPAAQLKDANGADPQTPMAPKRAEEAKQDASPTNNESHSYQVFPEIVTRQPGRPEHKHAEASQVPAASQPKQTTPRVPESQAVKLDGPVPSESKQVPTVAPALVSPPARTQQPPAADPMPLPNNPPEVKNGAPRPAESKHDQNVPLQTPAPVAPPQNGPSGKIDAAYVAQHKAALDQAKAAGKKTAAVKQADPLDAQPAKLTRLQKQRAELVSALNQYNQAEESKDPAILASRAQQVQIIEQGLQRIDQAIAGCANVTAVSLGEKYKDEDKKLGWRTETMNEQKLVADTNDPKIMEKMREATWQTTKYFTEAERENAKLHIKADGTVQGHLPQDQAGKPTERLGYVMDPAGQLHQFEPSAPQRATKKVIDPQTNQEKVVPVGAFDPAKNRLVYKMEATHHSSVLAGAPVAGAGELAVKQGKITTVTNFSGHYKPSTAALMQTVEQLLKQGALLDKQYVMFDESGKIKPLDGNAKKLYDSYVKSQATIAPLSAEYTSLTKRLEQRSANQQDTSKEDAELAVIGDKLRPIVLSLEKAKDLLAKMGAGPANRVGFKDAGGESKEAKDELQYPKDAPANVQYAEVANTTGMTGASFLETTRKEQSVPEFLRRGGNYRNPHGPKDAQGKPVSQADLKKEMLKELEKETARAYNESLDPRYSKDGQGGSYPRAEEVARAAAELEGAEQKLTEAGRQLSAQQPSARAKEAKDGSVGQRAGGPDEHAHVVNPRPSSPEEKSNTSPEHTYVVVPEAVRTAPEANSNKPAANAYVVFPEPPRPANPSQEDRSKASPKGAPGTVEAKSDQPTSSGTSRAEQRSGNPAAAAGPEATPEP